MKNNSCGICQKSFGAFRKRVDVSDGCVCTKCLSRARIKDFENASSHTVASTKEMLSERYPTVKRFSRTRAVGRYLQIDEKHRLFKVDGQIFLYENLLDYRLVENEFLERELGKEEILNTYSSMKICVKLKNAPANTVFLHICNNTVKTSSPLHGFFKRFAERHLSALSLVASESKGA